MERLLIPAAYLIGFILICIYLFFTEDKEDTSEMSSNVRYNKVEDDDHVIF